MELDHIVVTAATLREGTEWVEDLLSVRLTPGGRHTEMGTHNSLLSLGPSFYLQVVAVDQAPPPERPRWFNLDWFRGAPRLGAWFARVPDMDDALRDAMPGMSAPRSIGRNDFGWRVSVPPEAMTQEVCAAPALIELRGPSPASTLPDQGCRLVELQVGHEEPDSMRLPSIPCVKVVTASHPGLLAIIATPRGGRLLT